MTNYDGSLPRLKEDTEHIETARARRRQYWSALYSMRQEYLADNKGVYDLTARPTMHYWAEQKYGFKMGLDDAGNYTDSFQVSDPKKFMLFQIKYFK